MTFAGKALALTLVFMSVSAWSQNVPPSVSPGNLGRDTALPKPKSDPKTLLPKPAEQVTPSEAQKHQFQLKRIIIDGNTVFSDVDLAATYSQYLNRTIDVSVLFDIANDITRMYREQGYSLSLAYVPAQQINQSGVVSLAVVEGYIGEIVYTGDADVSARVKHLLNLLTLERPLTNQTLEASLLKLKDLPGVSIKTSIDRTETKAGETRLLVDIQQDNVLFNLGINNRGSQAQGPWRADLGATVFNVLGEDSALKIHGQIAQTAEEYQFYELGYKKVIHDLGTQIQFRAFASESQPDLALLDVLEYKSSSQQFTLGISHPLIRSRHQNLYLQGSFDYRHASSELLGEDYTEEDTRVLRLGAQYDWIDQTGSTTLLGVTVSKGLDIFDATANNADTKSRAEADFDFTAVKFDATRLQRLFGQTTLFVAATAQFTDVPLASSEQCGWGGEIMGRAYDEFELAGDTCFLASAELRQTYANPFFYVDYLQAYVFADAGQLNVLGDDEQSLDSQSAGFGVRAQVMTDQYFYAEVAFPLAEEVAQEESDDARFFMGWRMSY